ncbi:MAG TPA: hypothetical protein VM471_01910 [Phenylobacterium sp.]|nr:hypothetical protein [Phenylobacterium sp.]
MFNAISSFMRSLLGAQQSAAVLFQEQADAQVDAWLDHLALVEHQAEHGRLQAERAKARAAWAAMSDDERGAVLDWCDRLDAEGRLEDHQFFEQWLALRMQGYVGD